MGFLVKKTSIFIYIVTWELINSSEHKYENSPYIEPNPKDNSP